MAIAFSNLGVSVGLGSGGAANPDLNNDANQTEYTTTSWTPPSSGLIIVGVWSRASGGAPFPTITGNSLSWIQVKTYAFDSIYGLAWYAANASGSTTGVTTITYASAPAAGFISFFSAAGVDLSGGVAAAFVQTPTNDGTSATEGTVSLAAAGNANNRPIAIFTHHIDEVMVERMSWTEADDMHGPNPDRALHTQWRSDSFETTASATWATSSNWGGVAAELKAETATTSTSTTTTVSTSTSTSTSISSTSSSTTRSTSTSVSSSTSISSTSSSTTTSSSTSSSTSTSVSSSTSSSTTQSTSTTVSSSTSVSTSTSITTSTSTTTTLGAATLLPAIDTPVPRGLMFIEQVKFTEPYNLQLIGGDDQRLETFLAQRGIRSEDELRDIMDGEYHPRERPIITPYPPEVRPYTPSPGNGGGGGIPPGGGSPSPGNVPAPGVPTPPPGGGTPPGGGVLYPCGQVPVGGIIMWAGNVADLDSYCWRVCDGTPPTPDLRDRFIVGATGSYAIGDTGGSDTVDLSHTHDVGTLAADNESAHTHGIGTYAAANESSHTHGDGTYEAAAHTHGAGTLATGNESSHTHGSGSLATDSDSHSHSDGSYATDAEAAHSHVIGIQVNHIHGAGSYSASAPSAGSGHVVAYDSDTTLISKATFDAHTHSITGTAGASGSHSHGGATYQNGGHSHDVTGTSGSDSHSHSVNSGSTGSGSAHNHSVSGTTAAGSAHNHSVSGSTASDGPHDVSGTSGTGSAHTHTLSGTSGTGSAHTHTISGATDTGGNAAHDNRPQYYALAFIMRIA